MADNDTGQIKQTGQADEQYLVGIAGVCIRYIRDVFGQAALARLLEGLPKTRSLSELEDDASWSTYSEIAALFEAAVEVTGDLRVGFNLGRQMVKELSGTETVALLRSLGSPSEIYRNIGVASGKFSTAAVMEPLEVADNYATVSSTTRGGFPRHPQLCEYTKGLLSMAPTLFSMAPATIDESECQAKGAKRCLYHLQWGDSTEATVDDAAQTSDAEQQLAGMTQRLEEIYTTASDLLEVEDIDSVLARVAWHAGRAVSAPKYLLVVKLDSYTEPKIQSHGLEADEALSIANEILNSDNPDDMDGSRLIVDVSSQYKWYGRLAAIHPQGLKFFPHDKHMLSIYANYAASALATITALDEVRRSDTITKTLLDFGSVVARSKTVYEVAVTLLQTVPIVVGCDYVSVLLWEEDHQLLKEVANSEAVAFKAEPVGENTKEGENSIAGVNISGHHIDSILHTNIPLYLEQDDFLRQRLGLERYHDVIATPLLYFEQFLGVILTCFGSASRAKDATVSHKELFQQLSGLSDHAATAISNTKLLEKVSYMALHDSLTGLPNRMLFEDRANQELGRIHRTGESCGLLFIDLDNFKEINDVLGHDCGDMVLMETSERLKSVVRTQDTISRLGGDEFVMLVAGIDTVEADQVLEKLAGRVLTVLATPFDIKDNSVHISASIGITTAPKNGTIYTELLKQADTAMYSSKRKGRNTFSVFLG